MKIKTIEISICEACLGGLGEECHTPGCALFLHRVDLAIAPELYKIIREHAQTAPELLDACNALLGLIQLVCSRNDMPTDIKKVLEANHRIAEAVAAIQAERKAA